MRRYRIDGIQILRRGGIEMKCLYCGGGMKKAKVGYSINRKNYHLYLEEVPAYVCMQCKEKLFEEAEAQAIQKLVKHLESDVRQLQAV